MYSLLTRETEHNLLSCNCVAKILELCVAAYFSWKTVIAEAKNARVEEKPLLKVKKHSLACAILCCLYPEKDTNNSFKVGFCRGKESSNLDELITRWL